MKFVILSFLFLYGLQTYAIDISTPVGESSIASEFTVKILEPFQLSDGTLISNPNQITNLYFSSIWLGGASMTLVIDEKERKFKVPKNIYITKGYAIAYINTPAASTGQGIGVKTFNTPDGPENSYEVTEHNTCYSDPVDVCLFRHPNVCRYNVTAKGTESVLVEYSEQDYRSSVELTDENGTSVARLSYNTKDFDSEELYTVSKCDAEDNLRSTIRNVRAELRRSLAQEEKKKKRKKKEKKKKRKKKN